MARKTKGQEMNIKARIETALRSTGVWFNAVLLAALPFTDAILSGVRDNLPDMAPYLPPNIYKAVGFVVVVFNLVRAAQRAHQAALTKGVG
jgi:hypothetical protein